VEYLMRWYRENQHELVHDPVEARFRPNTDIDQACADLASAVVKRLS